jgi:hypothetical protein
MNAGAGADPSGSRYSGSDEGRRNTETAANAMTPPRHAPPTIIHERLARDSRVLGVAAAMGSRRRAVATVSA